MAGVHEAVETAEQLFAMAGHRAEAAVLMRGSAVKQDQHCFSPAQAEEEMEALFNALAGNGAISATDVLIRGCAGENESLPWLGCFCARDGRGPRAATAGSGTPL